MVNLDLIIKIKCVKCGKDSFFLYDNPINRRIIDYGLLSKKIDFLIEDSNKHPEKYCEKCKARSTLTGQKNGEHKKI